MSEWKRRLRWLRRLAQSWMSRAGRWREVIPDVASAGFRRKEPSLLSLPHLDESFRNRALAYQLFGLAVRFAAIDGALNAAETEAIAVHFPLPDKTGIEECISLMEKDANAPRYFVRQIIRLSQPWTRSFAEDVLHRLSALAEADGRAVLAEVALLQETAQQFGLPGSATLYLTTWFNGETNPYKLLKIDSHASNEAIRSAYRERMRELHPDKIASARYGEADMAQAGRELLAVKEAYQALARRHKIK